MERRRLARRRERVESKRKKKVVRKVRYRKIK